LDTHKDEPIQVGIVIANRDFEIVNFYRSFIRPSKNIKELKHVVGYITGLELKHLV